MNLPHSSWLECTPTPKAAIILWPAHVGILRVVRSAFSWLAERGQDLFMPWLMLSCMQLSSEHFGSLFGSIFVMWKCVHVCKLVLKLDFLSDFILLAESQIGILNTVSEAAGRWILWWNILTAHLERIFHTNLWCVVFLRGYNVIITLHLWNSLSPSETSRAEIGESCLKAEEAVRASAYLKALAGLNTTRTLGKELNEEPHEPLLLCVQPFVMGFTRWTKQGLVFLLGLSKWREQFHHAHTGGECGLLLEMVGACIHARPSLRQPHRPDSGESENENRFVTKFFVCTGAE